ncbi:hypothetical protein PL84_03625 [Vibrio anguillarum]|uniref:hypothetical protein n=1 Tax=Vibrio anguillarum TaxID=55601 RepID=UPI00097E2531|nr:hypothetical protein [Vibrio anguillarum]MBT2909671.1 hypothetical protein [Vibrio anguillarum]MBT2942478.1 hypothetical protein [Vibrio anguillarum]MBT2950698.1 hypothetical protein [Vibrio anguillarum]MBT2979710.1 hypothetical protein [Vibrio anguillarum]
MKPAVVIACLLGAALLGVIGTQQWSISRLEESLQIKSDDNVLLTKDKAQLEITLVGSEKQLAKAKQDLEVERVIAANRERSLSDNVGQLSSKLSQLNQALERERLNGSKSAECMDLNMPIGVIRLLDSSQNSDGG